MYRIDEANEKCESLADATWKMKMSYKNHEKKKDNRQIIILDKAPTVVNEQRNQIKLGQATTMAGKPCSFKAVCGGFCKKHRIDKGSGIGRKIKIGSKCKDHVGSGKPPTCNNSNVSLSHHKRSRTSYSNKAKWDRFH